jgi:hypothetical protein
MQTSVPQPRILFIDGLPGSGKSTAAKAVGECLRDSRVFAEMDADHPLLVGSQDQIGAAFADIHEKHSADSFASAALERLDAFLARAESGVLYVFESHPIQSTVRVMFQLNAPEAAISSFWSDLQDRLTSLQPRLIYFGERDPLQAFKRTTEIRGPDWTRYLVEAFEKAPWMRARGLSGVEGGAQMFVAYAELVDRLVDAWRFPVLKLPARPESYQARTEALTRWAMTPAG